MPLIFQIRTLDSLPWPAGLGKQGNYRDLERALRAHLGDHFYCPRAHRRAFEVGDTEYRRIVLHALRQKAWSSDVIDAVDKASALARSAPLLNRPLESVAPWLEWAQPHRESYPVWTSLTNPVAIGESFIAEGRHRLTFLRYHRPPEYELLVCAYTD